ncbi:MAG: class I SAM-dependent methyltransferase [Pseudomonadales bacterium]
MSKVIDSEGFYNQVTSFYDDISEKKIEYLNAIDHLILESVEQLNRTFNPKDVFHGDVVDYKKKPGEFNLALCLWNVIAHVDNPKTFLKAIHALLQPGGTLIFDINNRFNIKEYGIKNVFINLVKNNFLANPGSFTLNTNEIKTKVYIYNLAEITALLNETGFNINVVKFVNYKTGNIEKSQWAGQIFLVCKKLN